MAVRSLFCPIRQKHVNALPEECVRVKLLDHLVNVLGYPASGIAIEKELAGMPHLQTAVGPLPSRRADLICFAKDVKDTGELFPLLLIECKSIKLTRRMEEQVTGYNHFLKASFVALVNQDEVRTGWYSSEEGKYCFIPVLPSYAQLLSQVRRS